MSKRLSAQCDKPTYCRVVLASLCKPSGCGVEQKRYWPSEHFSPRLTKCVLTSIDPDACSTRNVLRHHTCSDIKGICFVRHRPCAANARGMVTAAASHILAYRCSRIYVRAEGHLVILSQPCPRYLFATIIIKYRSQNDTTSSHQSAQGGASARRYHTEATYIGRGDLFQPRTHVRGAMIACLC